MTTDDMELLRDYAMRQSEEAFATLVSRYVNLVYSAALRQLGDAHLAEEVTQSAFIILAQKAGALGPKTVLSAWLCRTAHYAAARALRTQRRRQIREQEVYMQSLSNPPEPEIPAWLEIAPLLDGAMAGLREKDYSAIVLRFFEGKDLKQVGAGLGVSENAANKRVSHALEKLRRYFSKRGLHSTTAIIAGAISANSVQAAPVALAKSVTAVALAKGAAASGSSATLIQGALKLMARTKLKTAALAGLVIVMAAGSLIVAVKVMRLPKAADAIALDAFYDMPASDFDSAGGYLYLSEMPRDLQRFADVALHIDGIACLWGGNCTAIQRLVFREEIPGIPVNRKFDSLYVYHNAFWAVPAGTPVYNLVFRYHDGSSVTNVIGYGTDVFDWDANPSDMSEPSNPDSMVAWRGKFNRNGGAQAARICLTEIKNRRRSIEVVSMNLYSAKSASTGWIAAMTTGPSGLVRKAKAARKAAH
jgi:RNA polymerase sigma factor (sigma-70 family)